MARPGALAQIKVADITAARIADYERAKATEIHPQLKRPITAATINRHLSVLRCLLRLAKKWGYVREVPTFEMGKEPEGRLRYLEREEAARLLTDCRVSKNPWVDASREAEGHVQRTRRLSESAGEFQTRAAREFYTRVRRVLGQ